MNEPELVLGPLLRYVDESQATVWVETSGPCVVEVLGCHAHTFEVEGHYYALVVISGLRPGETAAYSVSMDGRRVWPEGMPPRRRAPSVRGCRVHP